MNGALPAEVLEDLAQQFGRVNTAHDYGESQLSKMQENVKKAMATSKGHRWRCNSTTQKLTNSTNDSKPAKPAKPPKLAKPVKQTKPAKPAKPAKPSKTAKAAEAAEPYKKKKTKHVHLNLEPEHEEKQSKRARIDGKTSLKLKTEDILSDSDDSDESSLDSDSTDSN